MTSAMVNTKSSSVKSASMTRNYFSSAAEDLLSWYDLSARQLPWRVGPEQSKAGARQDPYRVWLSEVMLQQTTVPHAAPYYEKFLRFWPSVQALARADNDDVMREWAGLGYYARARNLHKCAKALSNLETFPDSIEGLLKLPGVGPYTAAAVGAIAFDLPIVPVDGNVERVISRLMAIADDGTTTGWARDKKEITAKVQELVPRRSGDFAQAMMDLGSGVCTPKSPKCDVCPWMNYCLANQEGNQEDYPAKPKRKLQPIRRGLAFIVVNEGKVLMQRRPENGLLGGMLMPLSSVWEEDAVLDIMQSQPIDGAWQHKGMAKHVFTHFVLHWDVYRLDVSIRPNSLAGEWVALSQVLDLGVPTVGKKALRLAMENA